jgi:hypothetical protein
LKKIIEKIKAILAKKTIAFVGAAAGMALFIFVFRQKWVALLGFILLYEYGKYNVVRLWNYLTMRKKKK